MSVHVRAALIGLAISSLCPLSALGAYVCADRDYLYVLGLVLFALAYLFSLPGFFVGWLIANGLHVESTFVGVSSVFMSNLAFYSFISFAVLSSRRKQLG